MTNNFANVKRLRAPRVRARVEAGDGTADFEEATGFPNQDAARQWALERAATCAGSFDVRPVL